MAGANPYAQYVSGNPYASYASMVEEPSKTPSDMEIATNPNLPRKQRFEAYLRADSEAAKNGGYRVGGAVTDFTGSPLLGTIARVFPDALQMLAGGNVGGAVGAPVLENAARGLVQSALKPVGTTARQIQRGKTAIQAVLENPGFNPSEGGLETVKKYIGQRAANVRQAIANSGAQVNTGQVADYVPSAYENFKNGPLAAQAVNDLGNVQDGFIGHPNIQGAKSIPVQLAQEMKSGYQKAIGDKGYGELKTPTTEGEKQIARGLRELIGQAVPSTVPELSKEASAIDALKVLQRRVAIDANKNPLGLGALISQPWMLPIWLWDRSPLAKTITGRALYQNSDSIPALLGASIPGLYDAQQQ